MSPLRTSICSFDLDPKGFVRATVDRGAEMTLEEAKLAIAETVRAAQEQRRPVLVDARWLKSESRDAREYFASDDVARACSAVALLVGSPVSRVIGNFFVRQRAQKVPTRLFTDEQAATLWLEEFVE